MKQFIIKRFFSLCVLAFVFSGTVHANDHNICVRFTNKTYVTSPVPAYVFDVELKAGDGYRAGGDHTKGNWGSMNLRLDIHKVQGVTFNPPAVAADAEETSKIADITMAKFIAKDLIAGQSPATAVAAIDILAIRDATDTNAENDLGETYVRLLTVTIPVTIAGETPAVFPELSLRTSPPYSKARVSFWANQGMLGVRLPFSTPATATMINVSQETISNVNVAILTATASDLENPTFKWYASQTSDAILHTGTVYTTPILTENNTYYVSTEETPYCENELGDRKEVEVLRSDATDNEQVAKKVKVYLSKGKLTVDTPDAETVRIFNVAGVLVYTAEKPTGKVIYQVSDFDDGVYAVTGSAGWSVKVLK